MSADLITIIRQHQGATDEQEPAETKDWSWILYIPLAFVVFAIGAAWLRWGA